MNYFAHAFPHLEKNNVAYYLAGLAIPDWLNVVDRKLKTRSKAAKHFLDTEIERNEREIALGIVRHHQDDQWFHDNQAFTILCLEFTLELRDLLAPDPGFRPSFLGHILVEILLDDCLIRQYPGKLDQYYEIMQQLDPHLVEATVSKIAGRDASNLQWFVGRYREIRFLYDYTNNEKLLMRLNQVMQRVKLLPLPDRVMDFFDSARKRVSQNLTQLYLEPRRQTDLVNGPG